MSISLPRPRISVYIGMSIDGYIARLDDRLDWLESMGPPEGEEEDYGFQTFLASIDTLIMGKNTYGVASRAVDSGIVTWPYVGKRVIVLSSSLIAVRPEAELFSGDILSLLDQLYASGSRHIYVDGGKTIQQFMQADLIDAFILSIVPVVLGSGIRLFGMIPHDAWFQVSSSHAYPNSLLQVRYERERSR